jgi:ATP adenylyltransferase
MILPVRHVGDVEDVTREEVGSVWSGVANAVRALKASYSPDGLNMGANLGRVAGAGIPGHFHVHVLPRWNGDTNFMTSVAETRVLPESLDATLEKLKKAWPK